MLALWNPEAPTLTCKIPWRKRSSHLCWGPRHLTPIQPQPSSNIESSIKEQNHHPFSPTELWEMIILFRPLNRWIVSGDQFVPIWLGLSHLAPSPTSQETPQLFCRTQANTLTGIKVYNSVFERIRGNGDVKAKYRWSPHTMKGFIFSCFQFIK